MIERKYFSKVVSDSFGAYLKIYIGYIEGRDVFLIINNKPVKVNPVADLKEATLEFSDFSITDQPDFLRALVDGLIEFGIKPSVPVPDDNEMKALKYHLEDMRKLVFRKGVRNK